MSDSKQELERRHTMTLAVDLSKGLRPALQIKPDGDTTLCAEVVGGPMDGVRCAVPGAVLTIGRNASSDLALPVDRSVSGQHARIVREEDHFWLDDLGSRNGTFLGDRRIENPALIGPGTLFVVGSTMLEFSIR